MKVVMNPCPYHWINGQSLAATVTSAPIEVLAFYGLFVQANVSNAASLNVSLALQYSADGVNWKQVPSDVTYAVNPQAVAANGTFVWEFAKVISYQYLRLVSTWTGGTGTLDVYISGVRV